MYRKRLKKEVKNEIMCHKYYINLENQIEILRKLIDVIIKLNNQLYERRLKRNPKREKYISQGRSQFNCQPRNYQSYRDPMEFDTTKQQLGQKGFQKKQNPFFRKKEGIKCYGCEKIGHIK